MPTSFLRARCPVLILLAVVLVVVGAVTLAAPSASASAVQSAGRTDVIKAPGNYWRPLPPPPTPAPNR